MAALSPTAIPDKEAIRAFVRSTAGQASPSGACIVSVRAHTRVRNGKPEQVAAYTRGNPDCGNELPAVIPVMARRPGPFDDPRGKPPLTEGGVGGGVPRGDIGPRGPSLGSAPGRGAARPDSGTSPAVPRVERTTQDRHTPGRQTDPTRSTLTAEPQGLLDRFAGRGQPVGSQRVGTPGSKERFDTGGEVIGIYRDPTTGRAAPTTRGIIHYSGRGAHIVPARPNGWSNQ